MTLTIIPAHEVREGEPRWWFEMLDDAEEFLRDMAEFTGGVRMTAREPRWATTAIVDRSDAIPHPMADEGSGPTCGPTCGPPTTSPGGPTVDLVGAREEPAVCEWSGCPAKNGGPCGFNGCMRRYYLAPHHDLKIWPEPFAAILDGTKHHEVRKNDRGFAVGHVLLLREWNRPRWEAPGPADGPSHPGGYTGRSIRARVTHLTAGGSHGLPADVCVMSIEPIESDKAISAAIHALPDVNATPPPFASMDRDGNGHHILTTQYDHHDSSEIGTVRFDDPECIAALGMFLVAYAREHGASAIHALPVPTPPAAVREGAVDGCGCDGEPHTCEDPDDELPRLREEHATLDACNMRQAEMIDALRVDLATQATRIKALEAALGEAIPSCESFMRAGLDAVLDAKIATVERLTADEWDAVRWAYSFVPDERKTDGTPAAAIIERLIDLASTTPTSGTTPATTHGETEKP